MCNLQARVCFYLTTLTVLGYVSGQKLEILPAQPEQTKPIGKPLLLTCKSDPASISELQWRDNKGRIVEKLIYGSKGNPSMYTEVLPDSGVTLFITSLTEDMAGEYTCTGNYANTEPLKTSVIVRAIYPIKWVDAPKNQFAKLHENFNIKCEVEANPAPIVDWLKDGEIITTNDKYVIQPKSLLVRNVQESDDGIYACRAAVISTRELETTYIRVEVQIPPEIKPMEEVEVTEGEQVAIQCKASGKPIPSYTWIKRNTQEDLSKTSRFTVNKETGLLVINKVAMDDHSAYECVATNNAWTTTIITKINVRVKPKFIQFSNITHGVGNKANLVCKVYGRPPPKILMRKFGSLNYFVIGQQPDNSGIIYHNIMNDTLESLGIVNFANLSRSDDGLYECMAENSAGTGWKNGHVTVQFRPSFDKFKNLPPVFTWGDRVGTLSCLAEAIPNATYKWTLNDIEIKNDNVFRIKFKLNRSYLFVKPGAEKRYYTQYKCIAMNMYGEAIQNIELREAKLPEKVQRARVLSLLYTTIQFEIIRPATRDNLPVTAFVVQYKEERSPQWQFNQLWSVDSPYILAYLEPGKSYFLQFAAINEVGLGPWGENTIVTMPRRSAPSEPAILSQPVEGVVNSPYPDFFELRWKIPADNGEPILLYEIKFCPVRRVNGDWLTSPDGCNTIERTENESPECRISPLKSDSHYKVELRALNVIGYSTPAELIVKTARDVHYHRYYNACSVCACNAELLLGVVVLSFLSWVRMH